MKAEAYLPCACLLDLFFVASAISGCLSEHCMKSSIIIVVVYEFEGRWIVFDIRPYDADRAIVARTDKVY
jgi:hypothetical protein